MARKNESGLYFVRNQILNFYEQKHVLDSLQSEFTDVKLNFNKVMDTFFDDLSEDGKHLIVEVNDKLNKYNLVVTKIISTKVSWDIEKLKKVLPRKFRKNVIKKKYQVVDWNGLFDYLKQTDVDFKTFKQYLSCEEYVLESSIDRLVDLGHVDSETIKGCCIVETKEPQYRIAKK